MPPKSLTFAISTIAAAFVLWCGQQAIAGDAAAKPAQSRVYQGTVTQNELIDNLERLGIKCVIREGAADKLVVNTVRLGSNAFYKGVCAGDTIKSVVSKNGLFELTIERAGKVYQLALKALTPENAQTSPLAAQAGRTTLHGSVDDKLAVADVGGHGIPTVDIGMKPPLVGGIDKKKEEEKKLTVYDIELVLDITGSMNVADGTGNLSKFAWCHEQVKTLAQRLAPYNKTLDITTFNDRFSTAEHCDPGKVEQLYASITPSGSTDLVDPLASRLEVCLARQRQSGHPQLLAIISDGLPNVPRDPRVVNRALIDFSQRLGKRGDVTITFLQIGDNFQGRDFCVDLDENLVNEGAKFDMVHTTTFDELKQEGIVDVLLDAIRDNANNATTAQRHLNRFAKSLPRSDVQLKSDAMLKEKKQERQELEKQLLGN